MVCMGRDSIRTKLYQESDLCRRCGIKTYLPEGLQKSNTATIQHNLFRFQEGYNEDLTLFCYKCNDEDNWIKLSSYNFLYNELYFKDLPHEILSVAAMGLISKPKKNNNPQHVTMSGVLFFQDKVIKMHNGIIKACIDFYANKFDILKIYLDLKIDGKMVFPFEDFYNRKTKNIIIVK